MRHTSIIYGEKKSERKKKLLIIAAVFVVFALVLIAYYTTRPEPEEAVARYTQDMLGALEILKIEYSEAVENGVVVKKSEYEGARVIMERVMKQFADMKPYAIQIDSKRTEEFERDLDLLKSMVDERSPPKDIDRLIDKISSGLREFPSK